MLELGTKAYPYRTIKPALAEILKHLSNQEVSVSVYLKANTITYLEDSTVFVVNMTAFTLQSYTDTGTTTEKATITTTEIAQPGLSGRATFNIMKDVTINVTVATEGQPFLDEELRFIGREGDGFQVIRSTISMENIIARRQANDKTSGFFIFLIYLQQKSLILSKDMNLTFRKF